MGPTPRSRGPAAALRRSVPPGQGAGRLRVSRPVRGREGCGYLRRRLPPGRRGRGALGHLRVLFHSHPRDWTEKNDALVEFTTILLEGTSKLLRVGELVRTSNATPGPHFMRFGSVKLYEGERELVVRADDNSHLGRAARVETLIRSQKRGSAVLKVWYAVPTVTGEGVPAGPQPLCGLPCPAALRPGRCSSRFGTVPSLLGLPRGPTIQCSAGPVRS